MNGLADLLDMGGYGRFVWPAFLTTAIVLIALLIASLRSLRANEAALTALERQIGSGDAGAGEQP